MHLAVSLVSVHVCRCVRAPGAGTVGLPVCVGLSASGLLTLARTSLPLSAADLTGESGRVAASPWSVRA